MHNELTGVMLDGLCPNTNIQGAMPRNSFAAATIYCFATQRGWVLQLEVTQPHPLLHFPWQWSFTRLEGWQTHGVIKGTNLYTRISSAQSWMHLRILIAIKELGGNLSRRPGQSKQKSEVLRRLDIVSTELLEFAGTNYHFSPSYFEQQYESYEYEFKAHTCCHGAP